MHLRNDFQLDFQLEPPVEKLGDLVHYRAPGYTRNTPFCIVLNLGECSMKSTTAIIDLIHCRIANDVIQTRNKTSNTQTIERP